MAQEPTRRALRQQGTPPYEFPLGSAIARAAAAAPAPAPVLERIGNWAQNTFPGIDSVRREVIDKTAENAAKGNIAGAIGNVVGAVPAYMAHGITDIVGRPAAALSGAVGSGLARFVGGAAGGTGEGLSDKVTVYPQAAPAAPKAVNQALAQGRAAAAAETMTPQDALAAALQKILTSPKATLSDISRAGGLVPSVAKGAPKLKDTVLAQTAALSESIYKDQLAQIDAALKDGKTDAETAGIDKQKATMAWFQRNGGLVGFDPTKLVGAQMMAPDEEN